MLAWLSTCLLFMLLPGPDMALVSSWALRSGSRAAWLSVLGINLSFLIYAALCLSGLAALLYSAPMAIWALKLAGGAYLVFLSFSSLASAPALTAGRVSASPFTSGFFSNLLNPKQMIFLLAVLPAFLPATSDWLDLLYLLASLLAVGLLFWLVWIFGLSRFSAFAPQTFLASFRFLLAAALFCLGAWLLFSAAAAALAA